MKKISILVMALVSSFLFAQQPQSFSELEAGNATTSTGNNPAIAVVNSNAEGGGVITTFTVDADFLDAVGANDCIDPVVLEDFAGGPAGINTCAGAGQSVSSDNPGCFPPGELQEGFAISATGAISNEVIYITAGSIGNSIDLIGPNSFGDNTLIEFDPPVYAVAMDIWSNSDPNTSITFTGPDLNETINVTLALGAEAFFGALSTELIASIEIVQAADSGELIGNLWFGCSEILSVNDNLLAQVEIYPNPVSNVLNVRMSSGLTVENAQLFDILGKNTGARLVNGQLDVSQLARGVYILNLETSGGTLTQKIVKQ